MEDVIRFKYDSVSKFSATLPLAFFKLHSRKVTPPSRTIQYLFLGIILRKIYMT